MLRWTHYLVAIMGVVTAELFQPSRAKNAPVLPKSLTL